MAKNSEKIPAKLGPGARKTIKEFIIILSQSSDLSYKLYLFGSQARGTFTPHSDVDLCIVVPSRRGFRKEKLQRDLNGEAALAGLLVDVIVVTQTDWDRDFISPILHEIRSHGVLICQKE